MNNEVQKPGRAVRGMILCAAAAGGVLFAGLTWGNVLRLSHAAGWPLYALLALLLTGALGVCAYMSATLCARGEEWKRFLPRAAIIVAALAARLALLDRVTSDYTSFLASWVDVFRQGGFMMLTQEIGDYNLPYQYILALIARSPIHDMYLIKLVSITFDFALALLMMRVTERMIDRRFATPVLFAVLFSPTVLLNGAYWAQCDTLYVFFVVMSLYWMLRDRPVRSVAFMAIAFSFKLQTIFFFPMALFGLLHKKYKLRHAAVFPLTYLLTLAPALALGRSLGSALMIYFNQSIGQYYERLTYNAGNIYQFFPTLFIGDDSGYRHLFLALPEIRTAQETYLSEANMMDLQSVALVFCIVIVLAVTAYLIAHRKELALNQVWGIALFAALFLPMVMPKMHDRYFFMAEMFAILYAARHPRRLPVPLLVGGASLICYAPFLMRQRPIPTQAAALMNLAALILVARDIYRSMRARANAMGEEARI